MPVSPLINKKYTYATLTVSKTNKFYEIYILNK